MSSIEERVKKIVVEQLGVKEEEVTTSASFVVYASPTTEGDRRDAGEASVQGENNKKTAHDATSLQNW